MVTLLDNWLQENRFAMHLIVENGTCSAGVAWEAIRISLVPNSEKLLEKFVDYDGFIKAIATSLLEVEEHPALRTIAQTGQQGIIEHWRELPDSSSFLDAAIGMLNCSLRIYLLEVNKHSVKATETFLTGPYQDCFTVKTLHYMCPVEHFELLLPELFVVDDDDMV